MTLTTMEISMSLNAITHDVQSVAEAISLAVRCDVEAVDETGIRIAATGNIRPKVGQRLEHGHVYRSAMESQHTIVIDAPGALEICEGCAIRGACYYYFSVVSPIVVDGVSVGVLAVVSFDTENAATLRLQSKNLALFIERMAGLVSAKYKEQLLMNSLDLAMAELTAIFNKMEKGLVALSTNGEVLHYNKLALRLLNIRHGSANGIELRNAILSLLDPPSISAPRIVSFGKKNFLVELETITVSGGHGDQILQLVSFLDYAYVKKNATSVTIDDRPITFDNILTQNAMMQKLIGFAKKIAVSKSTVLLTGASGTGKEMFARAIHHASGRRGNFIPINCGAIPEALLESELFGYDAGAFTGARKEGKPGKFELADEGTLFLDELGTMPLHLQSKLLRVLEERRVDRVGGKHSFAVDVRVIAATNEDLEARVRDGRFREDLYFRLNVIPLRILPLRERSDDILQLGSHYLARYCSMLNKNIEGFSDDFKAWMMNYCWPGNIRELSNVVEYAVNIEETNVLTTASLPPQFERQAPLPQYSDNERLRSDKLATILQQHGWGKSGKQRAAEAFGVSLATIYRWCHTYNLQRRKRPMPE